MESTTNIFHYVYKITNLINNKYYYGIHSTDNLNDHYMGSGLNIQRAIRKHSKENFCKEIICFTNNRQGAIDIERIIVNKETVKRKDCYNVAIGGHGGNLIAGLNEKRKGDIKTKKQKTWQNKSPKEISEINKRIQTTLNKRSPQDKNETSKKLSKAHKGRKLSDETKTKQSKWQKGKKLSKDHINKIKKNHHNVKGLNNPRYIHLTQEQEYFIKEKRNEGIYIKNIPQIFFERYGLKISGKVIYRILKAAYAA
jgi:hypothetical protein